MKPIKVMRYRYLSTAGNVSTGITLDDLKTGTSGVLSSDKLTLTNSGYGTATSLTTVGKTTGKWYFEGRLNAWTSWAEIGVQKAGSNLNSDIGQESGEYGYVNNGNGYFSGNYGVVTGSPYSPGSIVCVKLDMDMEKISFSVNNGAWTTPYSISSGEYFAAVQSSVGTSWTIRLKASSHAYPLPTGFSAYDPG